MQRYYAGVDLGGTKILTAVADGSGSILARSRLPTEVEEGEERIIANICRSLERALDDSGLELEQLEGVGIGSPGPLSISEGVIHATSNLPFADFPLRDMLEAEINLPVHLENDANAAALGEKLFGAGQGSGDQIYITVSTGIGGGIIIDDEVYHGCSDGAGEIGHMIIKPAGPTCGFGQHRGCLEAMASGTAISREAARLLKNERAHLLAELLEKREIDLEEEEIPGRLIARAARSGDEAVADVYSEMGFYLGLGVANLITLFNPELIVFGGGVMKARDLFWDDMEKSLADHALPSSRRRCELVEAELEDDTGVTGALAVAIAADSSG